jgi:hypothetical protein
MQLHPFCKFEFTYKLNLSFKVFSNLVFGTRPVKILVPKLAIPTKVFNVFLHSTQESSVKMAYFGTGYDRILFSSSLPHKSSYSLTLYNLGS